MPAHGTQRADCKGTAGGAVSIEITYNEDTALLPECLAKQRSGVLHASQSIGSKKPAKREIKLFAGVDPAIEVNARQQRWQIIRKPVFAAA
jgi:hypothetical protein